MFLQDKDAAVVGPVDRLLADVADAREAEPDLRPVMPELLQDLPDLSGMMTAVLFWSAACCPWAAQCSIAAAATATSPWPLRVGLVRMCSVLMDLRHLSRLTVR